MNNELYNKYKDLSQDELDYGFRKSCYEGHLEIVKYLIKNKSYL